jgi:hypothetical protein
MNKCIYYTDRNGLHFTKEEHIIPAGIGGKKKLNIGIVSDEFNNDFSKIEQEFMRNSLIAIPREFYGPGKRGSLSPSKSTKSLIHVQFDEKDNKPHLGYLMRGNPHLINQLIINDNKFSVSLIPEEDEISNLIEKFRQQLSTYTNVHIEIIENKLKEKTVLLGFYDNKWFLSRNENTDLNELTIVISKLKENFSIVGSPTYNKNLVTSHLNYSFNIYNLYRVYAKIAFNCLAHFEGKEFVQKKCFNDIRNWIAHGGKNKFVSFSKIKESEKLSFLPFPEKSHRIIITKINSCLFAIVSLYGHSFSESIKLSTEFDELFQLKMFICDWENGKEQTLFEFVNELNSKDDS